MPANKRLTVEVVDDELRISIGISTLKFAAEHSPGPPLTWYDEEIDEYMGFKITDEKYFAKGTARALKHEEEDGSTLVRILLNNAMMTAIEEGSLGVAEEPGVVEY